jgi:hypothetical protein
MHLPGTPAQPHCPVGGLDVPCKTGGIHQTPAHLKSEFLKSSHNFADINTIPMSSLPQSNLPGAAPRLAFFERRRAQRQMVLTQAQLTVLDGAGAGLVTGIQTRDLSMSGVCFLLRQELHVGQTCSIEVPGQPARNCEVIRSRPLSSGKYEIAVQFRR